MDNKWTIFVAAICMLLVFRGMHVDARPAHSVVNHDRFVRGIEKVLEDLRPSGNELKIREKREEEKEKKEVSTTPKPKAENFYRPKRRIH